MNRPNAGETPPNHPISPFHTPPAGYPIPVPGVPLNYHGQPLPPTPPSKSGPTPLGILNALKRRWVMAALIGGAAAVVAAVVGWFALPSGKHEARAHIQIRLTSSNGVTRPVDDPESFRRTQMFILKTRDLITRALADPSVASTETVQNAIKNGDDPVKLVEDNLKVTMEGPEIITVTLTGDNPEDMRVILDQMVKRYYDDATVLERKGRDDRRRQLESLAETFKREITAKEKNIKLMAESHTTTGVTDGAAVAARNQQELAALDAEVFQANKEIMELDAQIDLIRGKIDQKRFDFNATQVDTMLNSDERVLKLVLERARKEELLRIEKLRVPENTPLPPVVTSLQTAIKQLDDEIRTTKDRLRPDVETYLKTVTAAQLQDKLKDLEDRKEGVKKILAFRASYKKQLEDKVRTAIKGSFDVEGLRHELDPLRISLAKIETELVALRIENQLPSRVEIRQPAYVVLNKNLKQKILVATAGGLAALFGSLVLIGYLEWRTRRVDGVDQVVNELGMRVVGTVPAFPRRADLRVAEAAGAANWRFVLNESINSTRTMLLHTARKESMQVVMVTSATQGEGKTSLASQLATSMATAGMRTLIVDCDLRNPSIHKLFDLGLSAGVSEVLCAEADVSDAVQPTTVPNLWVIPAGQCSNRVINTLAQGHPLETLFNRLRGQFDFIIVDSCPVLPVADALLIGQHVDGVLFSIMHDISQLPKVLVASEKLAQLNIPLVGAVVNGIRQNTYSYGYNYVKQLPA